MTENLAAHFVEDNGYPMRVFRTCLQNEAGLLAWTHAPRT